MNQNRRMHKIMTSYIFDLRAFAKLDVAKAAAAMRTAGLDPKKTEDTQAFAAAFANGSQDSTDLDFHERAALIVAAERAPSEKPLICGLI
jgi:hypothetical protein